MPSAQPDPVAKATKRTSKAKGSTSGKETPGLDAADLLTELQFLKGLVVGLQEEVLNLKQAPAAMPAPEPQPAEPPAFVDLPEELALPSEPSQEDILDSQEEPESAPAPIFQVEPKPDLELPPIDYDESGGPYLPFDPASFADDFHLALEDPVPIDWAKWVEEENSNDDLLGSTEGDISESLEALAAEHPSLIENVLAFNAQHPPDYFVETPFEKLTESLSIKFEDHGVKVHLPPTPQNQPTAHDIMAELVAEAVQGQAVAAGDGSTSEPEPVIALDSIYSGSLPQGEQAGFGQDDGLADEADPVLDPDVLAQVPAIEAIRACLLPLSIEEGVVTCGIPKPIDYDAIKEFEEQTGFKVSMKPMGLRQVIHGLRQGYATKDEENYRASLLSGAAPPEPITLKERVLASIPFLKAEQ